MISPPRPFGNRIRFQQMVIAMAKTQSRMLLADVAGLGALNIPLDVFFQEKTLRQ